MQDRPKFPIIIPAYNRMQSLPRAIASVLAQTEKDIELIIVDEASTDGTQEYLATLSDPRIRVTGREPDSAPRRLGVSAARNLGLKTARADIVAFFDSDDVCRPHYVASHLAAYADNPDIICVICATLMLLGNGSRVSPVPDVTLPPRVFEWAVVTDLFPIFAPATSMRRDHAIAIGGFNAAISLAEDREDDGAPRATRRYPADLGRAVEKELDAGRAVAPGRESRPAASHFHGAMPGLSHALSKGRVLRYDQGSVADIRRGLWGALWRDLRAFRKAGLLEGGPLRWLRNHREVRRDRRDMKKPGALASIVDPPQRRD